MNEHIKDYRECFSTAAGKKVLAHLLADMGFFDDNVKPEEIILQNYARKILKNLGILHIENVQGMVEKLFELPIKE